jgi:uncharacterized protein (TIGR04141 family)
MMSDSLNRVTVYKLSNITSPASLKLAKYSPVADGQEKAMGLTFNYWLYFLGAPPAPASWFPVFSSIGLKPGTKIPKVQLPGFVLLAECKGEFYAFTGGLGHIALRAKNEIEPRFGSILAEKILSLAELRGLVQKDTSGAVMRIDRVFRRNYNPTGEIDNLRRILSHVRGTLSKENKLYAEIGRSIHAGNALTVNGAKSFKKLFSFLATVCKLWNSKSKKLNIPQLAYIDRKAEPLLIADLEKALVRGLSKYKPDANISLFLDSDELGFLPDTTTSYQLLYGHHKHLVTTTYQESLENIGKVLAGIAKESDRVDAFNSMRLRVSSDEGVTETRSLTYFVCGDVVFKNDCYFVNSGLWYRANASFLKLIDAELDNILCIDPSVFKLVPWDETRHSGKMGENKFNVACCTKGGHLLLDRRTVKIPAEICRRIDSSLILSSLISNIALLRMTASVWSPSNGRKTSLPSLVLRPRSGTMHRY